MQSTRYFIKSLLSIVQWTCFFREKPLAYFQNGQFKNVQNGIVGGNLFHVFETRYFSI
jgi:hypothetical protein